ncbi:Stage II sporulation protein E (SpoIIE) [Ruminococcaceae bacterium YRB3002]|nr:Stage II sporulation protein E (SpoIIE) [Ruminococcaceae bacterium YRB3002]
MRKKRSKSKLLVELLTATVPIFILAIGFVFFLLYRSIKDSYLTSQQDYMSSQLEQIEDRVVNLDHPWLLDYWEQNPEESKETIDLDESNRYSEYLDTVEEWDDYFWSENWMENLEDPVLKSYVAKQCYDSLGYAVVEEAFARDFKHIVIFDASRENAGFVFAMSDAKSEYYDPGYEKTLGTILNFNLDEHKVVRDSLSKNSPEIVYEKTDGFPGEGSYYVAYKPLMANGKIRAYLAVSLDWTDVVFNVVVPFMISAILALSGIALIFVIFFIVLYVRAIKPVDKIQQSVRAYIGDKDSSRVVSKMSEIKSKNEFGQLSDDISNLALEIDQYTQDIVHMTGERERVATELDMARNIQAGLLPSVFPPFPDRHEFDIYASMTPAKEVGGDFYDFFLVDDDHLALVIGDVSGKGIPASLFMMMTKMLIHNMLMHTMNGHTPHEVLERTNASICENNPLKMFVTVWLGILEISTGKVIASNAGHEYPVIRQADGTYELFKDKHGFVIGGIPGKKYKDYEFTLSHGGTLFVYTDGVPEATNTNNEMYGTDHLIEAMNGIGDTSPEDLLKRIHEDVNGFVGEGDQFDDLTMMGLRFN